MSNKKIYKNRLSLPIFDNKGIGNGNGVAYIPNVIRGGSAIPIGNNMFLMRGRSHAQGGIDIGKDLEVEGNEVVQNGKFGTKVFSSVPFLRGISPAQRVLQGENPDAVFAAQETWKRVNKINDDGSRKARKGKYVTNPNVVQSDNTRVAPILNNPPKPKEFRQGDFVYTPKQLVVDDKKGFVWQPASRRVSQIPLERTYPEFDFLMLPRVAANYATSPILQLERELSKGLKNIKIVNKPLKPKVRTRIGDVEIDNPKLLYHLDRGDGVGAFSNRGAYVEKGRLFPGIAKEGEVPYSWWNLGKPYSTKVKGQPMTRLMTAIKDTPGMLNVKSQNYPIGQWNGKGGFVTPFEYVNPKPVDVSNSTYILNPNYGWKKISNENLRSIFDIKNDIDFYNAANEFANKYGYETFDKSLVGNREALENAVKQMLNRHNTFYRGVVGDNATKRIAVDTPWKEGEGIWVSPQADYAQLYGQVGKLQRPYKLSSNRNNWFKDADFDYTFADDNVGLINPWQRNPKLYENIIIDKGVPHEIYAKDKLNFIDWVNDVKNAKGSNNIMNYKKFGGRIKSALGLSLFKPNSFKVRRVPINDFITPTLGEIEEPETPTYVLKDDEKPVGKKVNPNNIGGGRLYNGYAVDNHEGENVNSIGGGRVYATKPIDEFATDSVSFGDIKSPRGFKEQDADYIYDYLNKHSNLSDTAKAVILATAAFESGMDYKARNKYSTAKGLFQWLDDRYIPTPGLTDEQERIAQLNKIIDDMTPVKGKAKGWTQTKTRSIFDLANEFRTTDDIDRAVEIMTRHHIRPSLGEEPRKNKQGVEVDKGYKWEIAERRKVARQFYNRMFNRKNKKEFGGMKLNIFKLGGLSRSKDYGSKDKPYPSVNKNDFAGGGRSYPIPTRADAVDALRLAGLHHRSDVRAKVYAKYPDLRKKAAAGTKINEIPNNNDGLVVGDNLSFNQAFGTARRAGFHIFTWRGKKYTTDLADSSVDNNTYEGGTLPDLVVTGNRGRNANTILLREQNEDRINNLNSKSNTSNKKESTKSTSLGDRIKNVLTNSSIGSLFRNFNWTPKAREDYNPAEHPSRNIFVEGMKKQIEFNDALQRDWDKYRESRKNNSIRTNVLGRKEIPTPGTFDSGDFGGGGAGSRFGNPTEVQEDKYELIPVSVATRRTFNEAFADARKKGLKTFDFNGKKYTTELGNNPKSQSAGNRRYEDRLDIALIPRKKEDKNRKGTNEDIAKNTNRRLVNSVSSKFAFGGRAKAPMGTYQSNQTSRRNLFIELMKKQIAFNDALRRRGRNNNSNASETDFGDAKNIIDYVSKRRWKLPFEEDNEQTNSFSRSIDIDTLRKLYPYFHQSMDRPMYSTNPLVNRFDKVYNYGWSHNAKKEVPNYTDILSNVNPSNPVVTNTSRIINTNSEVSPAAQRILDNAEIAPYQTFRTPSLAEVASRYPISERINVGTTTSPISAFTGVQPNPTDVEAVRSGNFVGIDNDRYLPIRTTTEDWIGLGANLLGSVGSYLGTRAMLNRYPMPNKPVPAIAQKLKTRININPQLDTVREQVGRLNTSIDNNTSSSRVAQARKQGVSNNAVASRNQLYGQKENAETQLINQDIMNRQRIGLYNNQIYNDYLNRLGSARQYLANARISNFNNVLSGANQSIQDLLGRIENRDADRRNFIFMEAAYPNVNWRNIFQGNPELARSLGFRFVK